MKLTIESMTYGADGLAHADNGKAVFAVSYTHLTLPTT